MWSWPCNLHNPHKWKALQQVVKVDRIFGPVFCMAWDHRAGQPPALIAAANDGTKGISGIVIFSVDLQSEASKFEDRQRSPEDYRETTKKKVLTYKTMVRNDG